MSKKQLIRQLLLGDARDVFNRLGIGITLDTLARELDISKGKITNHFPTKDLLFLGILAEYERELAETASGFGWGEKAFNFTNFLAFLSLLMDVQYRYRCAMAFVAMITSEQRDLHDHVIENFRRNSTGIRQRIGAMVQGGLLRKDILEPAHLEPYMLAYVNLMTFWMVSATLYHDTNELEAVKTNCLRAVVQLYLPYLTEAGSKELQNLGYFAPMLPNNK